ncbi:MAG: glutamate 5-kinase [Eubacterium sp.]|nr:glutamate 5-kinase [Eubacterium sp.]
MDFSEKKRIVVKVGTSTLAHPTGSLNIRRVAKLIEVFSDLKNSGRELVFVTSGAQGVGAARAGLRHKPTEIPQKQACAAIGQCELMHIYDREFQKHNHTVAQVLLTRDVISNKLRKENVINTLDTLLDMGIVPIINANDTVSIEELDFDENDTLSAIVAKLCTADLLVILTDVEGLYDKNPSHPDAKLIPVVEKVTDEMIASAKDKGSEFASGGMLSKLEASIIAGESGIPTVIIKGSDPEILYDLFENKATCTVFKPQD